MKSYQFFKLDKRFYKEREKVLKVQSMKKEKKRKVGLCLIKSYFVRPFKVTVNQFFFNWSFC